MQVIFKINADRCYRNGDLAPYMELIWRMHGGPAQSIQSLDARGIPATLENILADQEQYDRQENSGDSYRLFNNRYNYEEVLHDIDYLIRAGMIDLCVYKDKTEQDKANYVDSRR